MQEAHKNLNQHHQNCS